MLFLRPFLAEFFAQGYNPFTQSFELAGIGHKHGELNGYGTLGKVRVYLLYNLVIVVSDPGKLPIEIVQACYVICLCRIAFIDVKISSENAGKNEMRYVAGTSCLFEHLPKARVLFSV